MGIPHSAMRFDGNDIAFIVMHIIQILLESH